MLDMPPPSILPADDRYVFRCWCSWYLGEVSKNCPECGGHALARNCPLCDGRCDSIWHRDVEMVCETMLFIVSEFTGVHHFLVYLTHYNNWMCY